MAADADRPILNITGEKIALGPMRRDLIPTYVRWMNDFEVTRTLGVGMAPMTLDAETTWYDDASQMNPSRVQYLIYERSSLRVIGSTDLREINHRHGTAEFGIVIGEKDCWDKGYGGEATALMLDYGFTILGLHNILLRVMSYNVRGIRAYQRAGFREVGRRREAHRLGGRTWDIVIMDCLATEFTGGVLRELVPDA